MTKQELIQRLRDMAGDMINLGADMEHYGGFSEIAQHGREMIGAGHIANEWADDIEGDRE